MSTVNSSLLKFLPLLVVMRNAVPETVAIRERRRLLRRSMKPPGCPMPVFDMPIAASLVANGAR